MKRTVRLQVRYSRSVDLVLAALAIAAILGGLVGGLVWSPGQVVASPAQVGQPVRIEYYLTQEKFPGDQVLSACTVGFHTASLWEILDTTNLRYNTRLGYTRRDSGYGPPTTGGWVRTGYASNSNDLAGESNCQAWTSDSGSEYGSWIYLPGSWEAGYETLMGWATGARACSDPLQVWCVGNESVIYLPLVMRSYSG